MNRPGAHDVSGISLDESVVPEAGLDSPGSPQLPSPVRARGSVPVTVCPVAVCPVAV